MMSRNICLFLLFQSVFSLHISINEDKGKDSSDCLKGQLPCQSMMHVADSFRLTSNLMIKIISSTLHLQGNVAFTGINGLTISGRWTNIKCNGTGINGSGIVFNNCSNVKLNNFTVEYCGLLYKQKNYCGQQAILFYNCSKFIILLQVNLNYSNGTGLVMYNVEGIVSIGQCVFSNNKLIFKDSNILRKFLKTCFGAVIGGGLRVIEKLRGYHLFSMHRCQFINNSASSTGGALYLTFNYRFLTIIHITNINFIGNTADISGGAIGITVYRHGELSAHSQYHINFYSCNIIGNVAQFGGGVALEITHESIKNNKIQTNDIRFHLCKFINNKAKVSSAVDIHGNNQKIYQSLHTIIIFQSNCQFRDNIAGIDLLHTHWHYKGKYFEATVFAIDVFVEFYDQALFYNNTGTPLYLTNSHLHFSSRSNVSFINNIGDQGGAILLDEEAAIDFYHGSRLHFSNNTAVIGGAIFIQSLVIVQYKAICFIQNDVTKAGTLLFMNNKASSGIGQDIFASTFQPCAQLYGSNMTALFTNGKMGTINFSSSIQHAVSTAPAMMLLNETHLFPYPGLPYTISITLLDEFSNSVTNLQLFPISAVLLNKSSISISNLAHSIANNYTITFKGQVGENDTLLLETTEYSAAILVNVTLYQCPPGYIFHKNSCHCSHSNENLYYYGILRCLEDYHAVIATGLWAGYIKEKFVTADCVVSLCIYHKEKYGEHVLPLNYSLLNNYVCASHRTGALCGTCNTGYTTHLHSPNYQCGESTHCQYGPFLYIISEIIPITGIFLVILFFNINLTSGTSYSFIFYSQIISNHYTLYQSYSGPLNYFFSTFKVFYGIFDLSIMEIDALSFCLFKNMTIMDLMMIKYLTTLYALFLIIATILILKFNSFYSCIKLCHKCGRRNIRGSVVNALTAFLVLCYFHCLVITLHILVPSYLMGVGGKTLKTVPLYSGDLLYMSNDHLKYVVPAIICLIIIIIPPPIILLSEPLLIQVSGALNIRRNIATYTLHKLRMKLKPFLDSFQGCFKDSCRCFAGFYFIYRILLVLIPVYWSEGTFWNIMIKQTLLFLILLLHCLCAPFQKKIFNHLNSFVLIDLLMINMLQLELTIKYNSTVTIMVVFQLVLMLLPLLYLMAYFGQYCRRYFVQKKLHALIDSNAEDDEFPARLIPELMESYNTFKQ